MLGSVKSHGKVGVLEEGSCEEVYPSSELCQEH